MHLGSGYEEGVRDGAASEDEDGEDAAGAGAGATVSNRPWSEHHFAFSGSPQPRHRN